MPSAFRPAAAVALVLLVAVCRGGDDHDDPRVPAGIVLVPNAPVVAQGSSLTLGATVVDINGRRIGGKHSLRFSAADTSVATVTPDGVVTSRGPLGTVRITADLEGLTSSVDVAVTQRVVGLRVRPEALVINRTLSAGLRVELMDYAGTPVSQRQGLVQFTSDNPAVATVGPSGRVHAPGPLGNAVITVTADTFHLAVPVRVVAIPTTVRVSPASVLLQPMTSVSLTVSVQDAAGLPIAGAPVGFEAKDAGIVSVSPAGVVTALGPTGSGTIAVTSGALRRTIGYIVGKVPGGRITRVPLAGLPYAVAVTDGGEMAVTLLNGMVALGTLSARAFPVTVPAGDLPLGIALSPDQRTAYVALGASARVVPVDLATGTPGAPSDLLASGLTPGVAVSPDGQTVYAGTETMVYRLSAADLTKLDSVPAAGPFNLVHHPTLPRLYVSERLSGNVVELDAISLATLRTFPVGPAPQGLGLAPDGSELYAVNEGTSELKVFDLTSGARLRTVPLAGGGFGVAVSASLIVVTEVRSERVQLFDRASGMELLNTPMPGSQPRRPVIYGNTIIIPDEGLSQVVFID